MWCSSSRRVQHLYLVSWYVILIDTMYDWVIVQLVHHMEFELDSLQVNCNLTCQNPSK